MQDYTNGKIKEKASLLKQIEKINFEILKLEKESKRIDLKITIKNTKIKALWATFQGGE